MFDLVARSVATALTTELRKSFGHFIELTEARRIAPKRTRLLEPQCPGIRSWLGNRTTHRGMPHDHDVVADLKMTRDPDFACDQAMLADARTAGNTDEGGHCRV